MRTILASHQLQFLGELASCLDLGGGGKGQLALTAGVWRELALSLTFQSYPSQPVGRNDPTVLRAGDLSLSLAGYRPYTLLGQDSRADPCGGEGTGELDQWA